MSHFRINFHGDDDLERRYIAALQRALDSAKRVKDGEDMNNEPVAWMFQGAFDISTYVSFEKPNPDIYPNPSPLYTHPVKELTLNIAEIHAVWAAGKYYELDKDGQVDEIKFTEFAYAILRKAQEK